MRKVDLRDILTEVSPERKDGTEVFTTVASHFWINVAGLPMSAQGTVKPQSALAGAIPKGIGSSTTPVGLSCLYDWMVTGRRGKITRSTVSPWMGAPACALLATCHLQAIALPTRPDSEDQEGLRIHLEGES